MLDARGRLLRAALGFVTLHAANYYRIETGGAFYPVFLIQPVAEQVGRQLMAKTARVH